MLVQGARFAASCFSGSLFPMQPLKTGMIGILSSSISQKVFAHKFSGPLVYTKSIMVVSAHKVAVPTQWTPSLQTNRGNSNHDQNSGNNQGNTSHIPWSRWLVASGDAHAYSKFQNCN